MIPVRLTDLPSAVADAVVAAEDARFYEHHGVDVIAIMRAAWGNVRAGEVVSGASTIEQQLLKNQYYHATTRRRVMQKVREAIGAVAWSVTHTKEETLEAYLNTVPFGRQARGIEAASQLYFHTAARDLNLAQAAMLAGIIAAPSAYDPIRNTEAAQARQAFVLREMQARGMLAEDAVAMIAEVRTPVFAPAHPIHAPHAVFRILEEVERTIPDIREGGYTIVTTLDPALQQALESRITARLAELGPKRVGNAAAVAIAPQTGEVLAYVGSADYFNDGISGRVDMAAAKRQPGSALKPFLYLLAFLQGIPASSPIDDSPVRFENAAGMPYEPQNYDGRFRGMVTLREALGSSLNVPAVRLLDRVGLSSYVNFLGAFGLSFPNPPEHYGLGIVLGGGEVTLFDATNAYAILAREGRAGGASLVQEVRRGTKKIVERAPLAGTPVVSNATQLALGTRLLTHVLADPTARVMSFGQWNLLDTGWRVAVKTGTTPDFRDNWAFGYTPDFALGVWVGNADNRPMDGVTGVTGAVPIWADMMRDRLQGTGDVPWHLEEGLVRQEVCVPSGIAATPACLKRRQEWFIPGTEPPTSEAVQGLRILSPLDGDRFYTDTRVAEGAQAVAFKASALTNGTAVWILNGERIETSQNPFFWKPVPGSHTLSLEGVSGGIHFSVSE
ncbi:MAG: penicillin-binding protein [Candidatus Parcubacteria bacterium]